MFFHYTELMRNEAVSSNIPMIYMSNISTIKEVVVSFGKYNNMLRL